MIFAHAHTDLYIAAIAGGAFGSFVASMTVWLWVRDNVLERKK